MKKCRAHNCWCGNREMQIDKIITREMDNFLALVDGQGVYLSDGGFTEHWADRSDFEAQYGEIEE